MQTIATRRETAAQKFVRRSCARITAVNLTVRHGKEPWLDDVSLTIEPGQLTAVIALAVPERARFWLHLRASRRTGRHITFQGNGAQGHDSGIGFVPQDDVLHGELPLRRTLRYAAPSG